LQKDRLCLHDQTDDIFGTKSGLLRKLTKACQHPRMSFLDDPLCGFWPESGTKRRRELSLLHVLCTHKPFNVKKADIIRYIEAGFTEDQNHVIGVH
jgi:hypothetical protein